MIISLLLALIAIQSCKKEREKASTKCAASAIRPKKSTYMYIIILDIKIFTCNQKDWING